MCQETAASSKCSLQEDQAVSTRSLPDHSSAVCNNDLEHAFFCSDRPVPMGPCNASLSQSLLQRSEGVEGAPHPQLSQGDNLARHTRRLWLGLLMEAWHWPSWLHHGLCHCRPLRFRLRLLHSRSRVQSGIGRRYPL